MANKNPVAADEGTADGGVGPEETAADLDRPAYRMGRRELLVMVSAIMAITAMGLDLMLPAFDDIRSEFDLGDSSTETSRIITIYFMGLATGQLFFGPIADRYGRKPTLAIGAVIYVVGSIGAALAPTFSMLLVARFGWGIGAAGARVVAMAIIRDRFEGAQMASAMSNVMAVFLLVPVLAPSVGVGLLAIFPWQSVFWSCAVFVCIVLLWSLRLRETLDPANRRDLKPRTVAAGYAQVARTKITFGYTIAAVFIQAGFIVYVAGIELIVTDVFDRKDQFPIIFGAVGVMFGLASLINGRIVERLGIDGVVNRTFGGLVGVLAAFNLLVLLSPGAPNILIFIGLLGLVMASFMFLMPNLGSAAMLPLGEIAGSGTALTGSVRIAAGSVIGGYAAEQVGSRVTLFVQSLTILIACAAVTVWLTRKGGIRGLLGTAQT